MKNVRLFNLILAIGIIIVINACQKEDDKTYRCSDFVYSEEIADEAQALSEATQNYSQDPTPVNCRAYRDAYREYIDELKSFESCIAPSQRQMWEQNIEDAEKALEEMDC